jgi:hypothetical protein
MTQLMTQLKTPSGFTIWEGHFVPQAKYDALMTQRTEAQKVIEDLLKLVDTELTPNVKHMFLQNYQLLNEAQINARRYLRDYP